MMSCHRTARTRLIVDFHDCSGTSGGPWMSLTALFLAAVLLVGCGKKGDMVVQPRHQAYEESRFFEDGAADRHLLPGVVARGAATEGEPAPPPLTAAALERGREGFGIYCQPCHGYSGYGKGIVVLRGYPSPPSYHTARLRGLSDRTVHQVIMHGRGKMPPQGGRVRDPALRWELIHYLRALQLSQQGTLEDVPAAEREALERTRGGR